MFPHTLLALLTDDSGRVLLVRRKNSLLWSLPGGEIRAPVASVQLYLAACCSRQVGVTPDFGGPLIEFDFAGTQVVMGVDEVPHDRARACGRIEASQWFRYDALPVELTPVACMAIALRARSLEERSIKARLPGRRLGLSA